MNDQRLPNYSDYLDSLNEYAKALKIKIKYKDGNYDGGEYYHHTRTLSLEPDLPEATEIAVFLHELGHTLDDSSHKSVKLEKAYESFYKEKATKKQKELVMNCEIRAWKFAEITAKLLKIPLGVWFYKQRAYFLKGYR